MATRVRGAGAAPWTPVDPLAAALYRVRMQGAFYCRTQAFAPCAVDMPGFPDCVSFHIVVSGHTWVELPGRAPLLLQAGDIALVADARGHRLSSGPGVRSAGRVDLLPQDMVGEHFSLLQVGARAPGREASVLLCGVVSFDQPEVKHLLALLPPVVHMRGGEGSARLHHTVGLIAAEVADLQPGGEAVTTRLADILVIQAIRAWLDGDAAGSVGWLAALRDPQVGVVIAAVHDDPGHAWSLQSMARHAAMSRSAFAARFAAVAGQPPMSYVTWWRMQVARGRLESGEATVARLAAELGYQSEAAFSRAFKRTVGAAPKFSKPGRR